MSHLIKIYTVFKFSYFRLCYLKELKLGVCSSYVLALWDYFFCLSGMDYFFSFFFFASVTLIYWDTFNCNGNYPKMETVSYKAEYV